MVILHRQLFKQIIINRGTILFELNYLHKRTKGLFNIEAENYL
jgi:hypothetical protein